MRRVAPVVIALAAVSLLGGCGSGSGSSSSSTSVAPLAVQSSDCRDWRATSDAVRLATTRYDLDGLRSAESSEGPATRDQVDALVAATTKACTGSDLGYATLVSTQSRLVLADSAKYLH